MGWGVYMLTEEHIKEGLSRAYVLAVAHRAGFNISKSEFDYGIDGTFKEVVIRGNRRAPGGFSIDYQLKSTTNVEFAEGFIKYKLESKNYNDLVEINTATPRILILFVLPKDDSQWLNINCESTILKNCAWWCSLKGKEPTKNKQKVTIEIPKEQLLTAETLCTLMERVKKGEEL